MIIDVVRCKRCGEPLEDPELLIKLCNKCCRIKIRSMMEISDKEISGGFIPDLSRCCGAPIRRTEGIIVEICTKCGKGNPPSPQYA